MSIVDNQTLPSNAYSIFTTESKKLEDRFNQEYKSGESAQVDLKLSILRSTRKFAERNISKLTESQNAFHKSVDQLKEDLPNLKHLDDTTKDKAYTLIDSSIERWNSIKYDGKQTDEIDTLIYNIKSRNHEFGKSVERKFWKPLFNRDILLRESYDNLEQATQALNDHLEFTTSKIKDGCSCSTNAQSDIEAATGVDNQSGSDQNSTLDTSEPNREVQRMNFGQLLWG